MIYTLILSVGNLACGLAGISGLVHVHWGLCAVELALAGALGVIAFEQWVERR